MVDQGEANHLKYHEKVGRNHFKGKYFWPSTRHGCRFNFVEKGWKFCDLIAIPALFLLIYIFSAALFPLEERLSSNSWTQRKLLRPRTRCRGSRSPPRDPSSSLSPRINQQSLENFRFLNHLRRYDIFHLMRLKCRLNVPIEILFLPSYHFYHNFVSCSWPKWQNLAAYSRICLVGRLSNRTILPKICLAGQFCQKSV